ncbi:hypothetical protein F66182_836 [Fusarium sp. NRRL 66182]|nr:hypothetical protein F66182_836 [Fusarium sp. NRRL 66182]
MNSIPSSPLLQGPLTVIKACRANIVQPAALSQSNLIVDHRLVVHEQHRFCPNMARTHASGVHGVASSLEPPAVQHLCRVLQIHQILVDEAYQHRASGLQDGIEIIRVPSYQDDTATMSTSDLELDRKVSDIAYICHTSGTSSGLPKPIPQTQFGVMGALYGFPGSEKPATFSTTPLYHGGLPDCLRAWTSGAAIWFFPEGHAPITGASILKALQFARAQGSSAVRYFSSVPCVLQMLAEEDKGLDMLQSMDLVGVGGAALPPAIGDGLVAAGVNLLSRMGSAECGFLMSSHRDYAQDREWQFLRPIDDPNLLSFASRENGLSELVVKPGWPFMAKTNLDHGSYATSDLFEPHSTIANAWRYHSRADAQITLANGKKFDPSPVEGSLLASSKLLRDVLIFGGGRDYAGVLLFPASTNVGAEGVVESVWPHIERMNVESQSHARITKTMLVVVPVEEGEKPLEKSSKGTILRRQAEERYADEIDRAYDGKDSYSSSSQAISDEELPAAVSDCFLQVLGRYVEPDQDLYRQGVDSIACIQIQKLVQNACLPQSTRLPLNMIYDQGTVNTLVEYLRRARKGDDQQNDDNGDAEIKAMQRLAEQYSDFQGAKPLSPTNKGNSVVLTGATGFLGTHILHLLQNDAKVDRVFCLLRAENTSAAHKRVSEALRQRGMPGLEEHQDKVVCLPCHLTDDDLGLSAEDRQHLLDDAGTIIHVAWAVNFSLRLNSFEDQIMGTRNLATFAAEVGARFVFISSVAAVSDSAATPIPETLSHDPNDASPLGYSRSKWVAERVCDAANEHVTSGNPSTSIVIVRVGQLCGNDAGIWNATEAYPLLLSTAKVAGCLPDIRHEALNWLPVEQAAQAVLEIACSTSSQLFKTPVYHVLNPHHTPSWTEMLRWISSSGRGPKFEIVSPQEWLKRLEKALGERDAYHHPSQALLGLWKQSLARKASSDAAAAEKNVHVFAVAQTQNLSATMGKVKPLDRGRMVKMWEWVNEAIQG